MRTRVYNKMTGREVEGYLTRGGKTMYVAVGVTEVHGAMPIDCEGIFPEAVALALAEETDGLAMVNLPYLDVYKRQQGGISDWTFGIF